MAPLRQESWEADVRQIEDLIRELVTGARAMPPPADMLPRESDFFVSRSDELAEITRALVSAGGDDPRIVGCTINCTATAGATGIP
jgi:hypothetical protein